MSTSWTHQYLALTADLDNSRAIPPEQRPAVQELLRELTQERRLQPHHAKTGDLRKQPGIHGQLTQLELTAGDRLQCLFRLGERPTAEQAAWRMAQDCARTVTELVLAIALRAARFPDWRLRFSFGLGLGAVTLPVREYEVRLSDGPCFHRAQAALERAKKDRIALSASGFGTLVGKARMSGEDLALSGLFSTLGALIGGWTARQAEIVERTLPHGFFAADTAATERQLALADQVARTEVAEELAVSVPTISKSVGAAQLVAVRHGAFAAAWTLARAWRAAVERDSGEGLG